jgi:signal transduction histidine kinase
MADETPRSLLAICSRAVSHELRNRVNAARLSLSAYRRAPESRDEELLDNLDHSLSLLEDAVGDVLAVALLQGRALDGGRRPLADLVAELAPDLTELALARNVAVRLGEPWPRLEVEAAPFQVALLNLVSSAIQRSDRTRADRWVEIAACSTDHHGEWRVEVRDNGAGVVPREVARGEDETGFRVGSGDRSVGWVLAEEAVRQLGGRLELGQGGGAVTTASFTLREAETGAAAS